LAACFLFPLIISINTPVNTSPIDIHWYMFMGWLYMKIEMTTVKNFLVVVTILRIKGEKLAIV